MSTPEQEGLFYPDGSFKSTKQIQYEHLDEPIVIRDKVQGRLPTFDEWTEELSRRRDLRNEVEGTPEVIDIEIETNKPIVIPTIGDVHAGAYELDYELLRKDVKFSAMNPQCRPILGGDMIDGFFFNPAQDGDIASFNEQRLFTKSLIDEIGADKILFAEMGDHDSWAEKMGTTMYDEFRDRYGFHIVRGSTIARLHLPGAMYSIVSAHQLPGHSMYNDTHPEMRESKFGTQGADIYIGFHTHKKSIHKQAVDNIDGGKYQLFVSGGPYKYSDEYAKKKGYSKQGSHRRGAVWIVLYPDRKQMEAYWSVEEVENALYKL